MFRLQAAHRPSSGSQICQICTSVISRNSRPAKRPFAVLAAAGKARRRSEATTIRQLLPREGSSLSRTWSDLGLSPTPIGWTSGTRTAAFSSTAARSLGDGCQDQSQNPTLRHGAAAAAGAAAAGRQPLPPLNKVVAPVQHVKRSFLSQDGIPAEDSTLSALRTCEIAAGLLRNVSVPPQQSALEPDASSSTSALLSLDGAQKSALAGSGAATAGVGGSAGAAPLPSHPAQRSQPKPGQPLARRSTQTASATGTVNAPAAVSPSQQLESAIDTISDAAFSIISLPTVFITPKILELYVRVQSRLGRPETLPHVLSMYASKPAPQADGSTIRYLKQNPDKPANAVQPTIAEAALDVAIEARNMDAAVAVIESTYTTKAFVRSKLLRKALLPVSCFAAVPACVYVLASGLSRLQHTMDDSTATIVAFAGIVTYLGFTGSIGLVASFTGNDHMKRVTWAPGTPLTQRWVREEERAALDKVACSFGFSEPHRYGEEEGAEFEALREYILHKGMILDRVELMEGAGQ